MNTEKIIFDENYNKTMEKLEVQKKTPGFSIEMIRGELEDLYRYEGLDWTGRGGIKQAEIEGAILAYQVFLRNISEEQI